MCFNALEDDLRIEYKNSLRDREGVRKTHLNNNSDTLLKKKGESWTIPEAKRPWGYVRNSRTTLDIQLQIKKLQEDLRKDISSYSKLYILKKNLLLFVALIKGIVQ